MARTGRSYPSRINAAQQTARLYHFPVAYTQSAGGTLTSSGAAVKATTKPAAGTLTSSGAAPYVLSHTKSAGGTLTTAGAITKTTAKAAAGAITPTGALVKVTAKVAAGTLAPTGTAARTFNRSVAGTLTSSGAITKAIAKPAAGTLTTAGAAVKATAKKAAGTLTTAGAIVKVTAKAAGGTLAPTGATRNLTTKAAGGTLFPSGGTLVVSLPTSHAVRVDLLDAAETRIGTGPLTTVARVSYEYKLDQIGAAEVLISATDPQVALIGSRKILWIYVYGEGLVFRMVITGKQTTVNADGARMLRVYGYSYAQRLIDANVAMGLAFSGVSLSAAVGANASSGTLLYNAGDTNNPVTGWTAGALDTPAYNVTARFDGLSVWGALAEVAKTFLCHVREDTITLSGATPVKKVDVGAFGSLNSLTFSNLGAPVVNDSNVSMVPLTSIETDEDSAGLVNSVIMQGGGAAGNALTLRYSTRSVAGGFAYDITSFTGPDGTTQYCIEDATSIAAYGRVRKAFSVQQAVPLAQTQAAVIAAANALYDVGVQYLQRHKDPIVSYKFQATGLKHIYAGAQQIKVGDKSRLRFDGSVQDSVGAAWRSWLAVDANVWIMGFKRTIDVGASDVWELETATVDALADNDVSKAAQAYADLYAVKTAVKPYSFRNSYVLTPQSIDGSTAAVLSVPLDANVTYLHLAKLRWRYRALRSNVSAAAAGGSSTPTSSSGGSSAPTSSAGSSHTHTISGTAASSAGSHRHQMFSYSGTGSSGSPTGSSSFTGPPDASHVSTQGRSASHTHVETGGTTNTETVDHSHSLNGHTHQSPVALTYTIYTSKDSGGSNQNFNLLTIGALTQQLYTYETATDHTHTISGSANSAEASHTHTVTISAHTHTVTIGTHTHTLTYGIFDSSAPSGITGTITINGTSRTAAMQAANNPAAPWDSPGTWYIADVTAYLQTTGTEFPLQQTNTITFGAAVLADVEAVLDIDMTRMSLLPV